MKYHENRARDLPASPLGWADRERILHADSCSRRDGAKTVGPTVNSRASKLVMQSRYELECRQDSPVWPRGVGSQGANNQTFLTTRRKP